MNYPYLAGFLESELRALAYDSKFLSFKKSDDNARMEYVKKLIENAHKKTIDFESTVKAKMSASS
jgi:hypothetical protein